MKRNVICVAILIGAILFVTSPAWAISLSFEPVASTVDVGGLFDVDINISGLENEDLAGFDFNVLFDESYLAFDSYTLGSDLGSDTDDWSFGYLGSGEVNLASVAWDWDLSSQADEFTLATLTFGGLQAGLTDLTLDVSPDYGLSDAFGGTLEFEPYFGSDVPNIAAVGDVLVTPEPGTLLLLGFGLLGLAGFRRKLKKQN